LAVKYQKRIIMRFLMYPNGADIVYKSANPATGATTEIELKVTTRKEGEKVDIHLKDLR
jgi:hypothetical protein